MGWSPQLRLLVLSATAVIAAGSAALAAGGRTPATAAQLGGFAGRPPGPSRPLDRDVESGARSLKPVPCAAGGRAACWILDSNP